MVSLIDFRLTSPDSINPENQEREKTIIDAVSMMCALKKNALSGEFEIDRGTKAAKPKEVGGIYRTRGLEGFERL